MKRNCYKDTESVHYAQRTLCSILDTNTCKQVSSQITYQERSINGNKNDNKTKKERELMRTLMAVYTQLSLHASHYAGPFYQSSSQSSQLL